MPRTHEGESFVSQLHPDPVSPKVKGSDARKVLLADLLWRRTVVSQDWLAAKLAMKSAANVSQQLRRLDRKAAIKKVPKELKHFLEEADAPNS